MISANRHVLSSDKFMVLLLYTVSFLSLFQTGSITAFLIRSCHPRTFIPTSESRYDADCSSLLKAVDKSNVIEVTDSNYRELFRGDKFLLLDAFAQW